MVVWLLCSCLRVNTQRSSLCYVTTKRTFECTNVMGLVSSLKEWLFRGRISSRGRQNLWKKSIVCHSAKNILGITGIFTWKRKRKRRWYHRFYTMKKKLTFPCCHRSILYVCVMFAEKSFCFLLPLDSIVFSGDHLLLKKKKKKHRFCQKHKREFFLSKFVRVSWWWWWKNWFRKSYESICRESVWV